MSTVVEELILKLGLDTKGLDSVDPVNKKLGDLNSTVEKLDTNLKSVEETLLNIGRLGDITIKLGETKSSSTEDKQGKKESTSKVDKNNAQGVRIPTTIKSLLTKLGAPVAAISGVVYLFKSMAQAAMNLWNVSKGFINESKELANVGKFSGIAASKLKGLGSMAEFLGYKSEDTIADFEQMGRTFIKMKPGDYHEGLAQMGIVPYERDGVPKSTEKILGEIAHYFTRNDKSITEKYRIGDQLLKIGQGTVELLSMGWGPLNERIAGFQKSGLIPTDADIQEERLQGRVAAFNKARASTIGRKGITSITDLLTGTVAAMFGTAGATETLDAIIKNGPEKTMKQLEGKISKEKLNQLKRMFGVAVDESGMQSSSNIGYSGFYNGMWMPGQGVSDLTVQSATFNIQQRKDGTVESATVNGKPIKNIKMASPVPASQ